MRSKTITTDANQKYVESIERDQEAKHKAKLSKCDTKGPRD